MIWRLLGKLLVVPSIACKRLVILLNFLTRELGYKRDVKQRDSKERAMITHQEVYKGLEITITFNNAFVYLASILGVGFQSGFDSQNAAIAFARKELDNLWSFVAQESENA